jgi:methylenetetrahydrofolate reductase (NADPH)
MKKITDILKEKKFTWSVELVPPRNGTPCDEIFEKLERLKGKIDFVSITKGAGGSLRSGTLPISYFAQSRFGINTIAHFVCRERTKYEIENELMDLYYFGIVNILALRGDPPAGQKGEWNGDYKYAYLLANQIKDMNSEMYLPRINADEGFRKGLKTNFCVIAAGHPEDPFEEELEHIKAKIDAGAEVIITQMIFSFDEYKEYVENLRKNNIKLPVIPGIRPLTSFKQAQSIENFFKLTPAEPLKEGLKNAKTDKDAYEFGINYIVDMIRKLMDYGAPGVHLFVLNDVGVVEELKKRVTGLEN